MISILRAADIDKLTEEMLLMPTLLMKHLFKSVKKQYDNLLWRFLDNDKKQLFYFRAYFLFYIPKKSADKKYSQKLALIEANRVYKFEISKNADSKVTSYDQDFRNWLRRMRKRDIPFEKMGILLQIK